MKLKHTKGPYKLEAPSASPSEAPSAAPSAFPSEAASAAPNEFLSASSGSRAAELQLQLWNSSIGTPAAEPPNVFRARARASARVIWLSNVRESWVGGNLPEP